MMLQSSVMFCHLSTNTLRTKLPSFSVNHQYSCAKTAVEISKGTETVIFA